MLDVVMALDLGDMRMITVEEDEEEVAATTEVVRTEIAAGTKIGDHTKTIEDEKDIA